MPRGRDASLELAYAASDAYQEEAANLAVIERLLDDLFQRAEVEEHVAETLRHELCSVLATNQTAPACMRMMALANEIRMAIDEADAGSSWSERRAWRKHAEKTRAELVSQLAVTLDALLAESS